MAGFLDLRTLFDTADFPRRWQCGRFTPVHGWTHILGDLAIWGAYTAIPIVLAIFVVRRRDVPFPRIFWLFCAFILSCGLNHLMDATIFWWPAYRLAAVLKILTAVASWATVLALIPAVPRALALPGLQRLNETLQRRNEEMEQFVYTVSHDLKSPLVNIEGFAGFLAQDLASGRTDRLGDFAQRISRASVKMRETIHTLLEIGRIGRVVDEPEPVDLAELVAAWARDEADALARAGARRHRSLRLPARPADPHHYHADHSDRSPSPGPLGRRRQG